MIRNKIIIVEDDPGISKYLQAALRGHDYEPMLATDGAGDDRLALSGSAAAGSRPAGYGRQRDHPLRPFVEPHADHRHLGAQRGAR